MPASPYGFYFLTSGDDIFQMTPGLLTGLPIGLVASDGNDSVSGSTDGELMNGNQGNDTMEGGGVTISY